ncbi:MAG: hypothetical protein QXW97_04485 [Candidatus Pacearchaeota archaeon]
MKSKKRGKSKNKIIKKTSKPKINYKKNTKKYWIIGGKLGAIFGLLICLISMLVLLFYNSKCSEADNCMIDAPDYVKISYNVFSVGSWPIIEFIKSGQMNKITYIILGVLILIAEYFILGAIIGIIVESILKFQKK